MPLNLLLGHTEATLCRLCLLQGFDPIKELLVVLVDCGNSMLRPLEATLHPISSSSSSHPLSCDISG